MAATTRRRSILPCPPLFLIAPDRLAALERRYNGPIPRAELLAVQALERHARAQSALFGRLARDSLTGIARRRAAIVTAHHDARLAALTRNLAFYRRQALAWREN